MAYQPPTKAQLELQLSVAKEEGRQEGRQEALDILERKYLDDKHRPDRGTPASTAILQLAREVNDELRARA